MSLNERPGVGGFSPCPACGEIGFSIQAWSDGEKMMQCSTEDCRVDQYAEIPPEEGE